jgi:hypothetical protein
MRQENCGSLLHMASRFGNAPLANLIFATWYCFHQEEIDRELELFAGDVSIRKFETRKRFGKFVDCENVLLSCLH